ncbi:MAG TPA: SpoIID/LytB domain-containing protein, partial [Nannocystis sp.]
MLRLPTVCLLAALPAAALCFVESARAAPVLAGDPQEADPGLVASGEYRSEPLRQAQRKHGGAPGDLAQPDAPPTAVTPAPLPSAFCQIKVNGVPKDTETDYLPHVIQCENGGANLEALKAQAIAARSVAYYAMAENGTICDGQGCQVYSCGSQPSAIHIQAVQETAGQYLSFNNTEKGRVLTYAFFVSGDNDQTANCHGVSLNANTENYVTYNEGKTWTGVKETSLGFQYKTPSAYGYGQNRGCMSQWSARCLENNKGYKYDAIIRYFYGEDIEIAQAQGPCVGKVDFAAKYAAQSFPLASQPAVVLTQGEVYDAWIDLTNVGDQTWTANTKLAPTPRDVASPLAGGMWLSPTRITGPDADTPPDAVGRFSFQIAANEPGDYFQTFGLVEEGVTWFADGPKGGGPPDDQLEIHVTVVPAPPDPSTGTGTEDTGVDVTGSDATGPDVTSATASDGSGEGTSGSASGSASASGTGDATGDTPTTGGVGSSGDEGGSSGGPMGEDDDSGCGCRGTDSAPMGLLTPL